MLKRGICYVDELTTFWGISSRPISYRLLKESSSGNEDGVQAFETIVKDLELSCGVCRTTFRGRLLEVDQWAEPYLLALNHEKGSLEVHDWAASDALASSEWAKGLFQKLSSCQFTASDLTLYLVEVSRGGSEAFIFEPNGSPLQYVRPPFVVQFNRRDSWVYLANRLVRVWADWQASVIKKKISHYQWNGPDDASEVFDGRTRIRLLPLVHPDALAFQKEIENFRITSHSALCCLPNPVDVIRTMNIYNRRYFTEKKLAQGARAVFQSLRVGGLWIVGRTVNEGMPIMNDVTILRRSEHGFQLLDRLNGGSELDVSVERWGYLKNLMDGALTA